MPRFQLVGYILVLTLAVVVPRAAAGTVVFSSGGIVLPESIALAPAGFGAYAGNYLITDPGTGVIWSVPSSGGAPTMFAALITTSFNAGVFAPAGYGAFTGDFLVGRNDGMVAFDSAGTESVFSTTPGTVWYTGSLAPAGFGAYAGQPVYVGGIISVIGDRQVSAFAPNGTPITIADLGTSTATWWGTAFSNDGTTMYVGDFRSGTIEKVMANGTVLPFTTVPLRTYEMGIRQMAMAPVGYPDIGGLLIVSLGASDGGGGTYGEVVAIDPVTGQVVKSLRAGTYDNALDPRGIYLEPDGNVLIANADPAILQSASSDFLPGRANDPAATPEPGTGLFVLAGLGLAAVRALRRNH